MAFDDNGGGVLQQSLFGGQPLRGRRQGRYRNYYQEQQDQQEQPQEQPQMINEPPPPQEVFSPIIQGALAKGRPYSFQGRPQLHVGGGEVGSERWNTGGGPINRLYGGAQPTESGGWGGAGQGGQWGGSKQPKQPYGGAPQFGGAVNQFANRYGQGAQQQQSPMLGPNAAPGAVDQRGGPVQGFPQQGGPQQGGPPMGGPEQAPQGPTSQWRGFTNAGGQWGGGNWNPEAIQVGQYANQLEGFNLDKLNLQHEDSNTAKYAFARAASNVDVKSPNAAQQVVEQLAQMGIRAQVDNPDGEADRITFLDTGESVDIMRGGAQVGPAGWQWIDASYGGQPVDGQGQGGFDPMTGQPLDMNITQQALAGGPQAIQDIGGSDYVAKLMQQLQQLNPEVYQQLQQSGFGR